MKCDNCGSTKLEWSVTTWSGSDAPDGRLRMNEVQCIAYLYCTECDETLETIHEAEINDLLNRNFHQGEKS